MFEGFSPETIDFLWGIRMNNNRDWFLEHKKQYEDALYGPMKALGKELFRPFLDTPDTVLKVSRIYRDARMHPPEPYKESLWICIRPDVDWWGENPCLYFQITPEGADYGFFLWKPRPTTVEEFRNYIAGHSEKFLKVVRETEAAVGQPITAACYKRPKPCAQPELERFFSWKGEIGCTRVIAPGPELFDPALGQKVGDFFEKLTPLYRFFTRFRT
ncbi:MAG: DUF2461 domain-containing protein [Faecousia sp.]